MFSAGESIDYREGREQDMEITNRTPGKSFGALESTDGCQDWITRTEVAVPCSQGDKAAGLIDDECNDGDQQPGWERRGWQAQRLNRVMLRERNQANL